MSWTDSLIRIRNFEIEELRKRLMALLDRRAALEAELGALDEEARMEAEHARRDAAAGWYMAGFRVGWKQRRARVEADLRGLDAEEAGARDALSDAFEALKKVEKAADGIAAAAAKDTARRESQAMDEQALRRRIVG
jgi:flagellar FliJ protein